MHESFIQLGLRTFNVPILKLVPFYCNKLVTVIVSCRNCIRKTRGMTERSVQPKYSINSLTDVCNFNFFSGNDTHGPPVEVGAMGGKELWPQKA